MSHLNSVFLVLFLVSTATATRSQPSYVLPIDVLHYDITLEPDVSQKTVTGTTIIKFNSNIQGLNSVAFDCGALIVDSVKQSGATRQFSMSDHHLKVSLPPLKRGQSTELAITYHGARRVVIRFFPDLS